MKRSTLIVAGAATLLAAVVVFRVFFGGKPVLVVPAVRGTAMEVAYATATVEAINRAHVRAHVSGTVAQLLVKEGDAVASDALLAKLSAPAVQADLGRSRADASQLDAQIVAVAADLRNAAADRDRTRHLLADNSATKSDYDRAQSRAVALQAQIAGLDAQRRAIREDVRARTSGASPTERTPRDLEVRAPLAGTVLRRSVVVGDFVTQDQSLFVVGDISTLVVECLVDETDVSRLTRETPVEVGFRAFADGHFRGHILEIPEDADRDRHAYIVKVQILDAPPGLKSGMGAEVNFILEKRDGALLVPPEAIDRDGAVHVVSGRSIVRRPVTIGLRGRSAVEVKSGLNDGERVIVGDGLELAPGTSVRAELRPPVPTGKGVGG